MQRSIATKLSLVACALTLRVIVVVLAYDITVSRRMPAGEGLILLLVMGLVTAFIWRFCCRLLVRPLERLERGIEAASDGRLEPVEVATTGDEIESLSRGFNRLIESLAASRAEVREYNEQLEQKVRSRTDELEQALEKAIQATRAKSDFLANVSHELRSPLSGVIGMLELILESPLNAEQEEHLKAAKNCSHSLLSLLNSLLDLAKIEAGRMTLEEIPFEPRPLLGDCVKTYLAKARAKGLTLTWSVDAEVPRLLVGDPLRVRQILSNLLSNAVKFTTQGTVRVELRRPSAADDPGRAGVEIVVADTGDGIDAAHQAVIFEQFAQADRSISRRYGGTGLGLAIVRNLVELQGGRIRLESAPGQGSRFGVLLPLAAASSQPTWEDESAQQAAPAGTGAMPGAILLVEDNVINQKVVTSLLRKKGHEVDVANHGQEALDMLAHRRYRLVLMDVQMPVLDGLEATHRIRSTPELAGLPIIAMTAHAMNGDRERCLGAGMNEYLAKPVDHKQLLALVEQYLSAEQAPPARRAEAPLEADPSLVSQMRQLFVHLAPERLDRMRQAVAGGDMGQVREDAKRIQGAARSLSAAAVVRWADTLESAAAGEDMEAVRTSLQNLANEVGRVLEAVENSTAN